MAQSDEPVPRSDSTKQVTDKPLIYQILESPAQNVKAAIQMLIGLGTVVVLGIVIVRHVRNGGVWATLSLNTRQQLFDLVGYGLAAAAGVELAYTLFTHGPDEALDPLALGLSAALLLQLGKVDKFDIKEGVACFLYVLALAGLFAIRRFVSNLESTGGAKPKHSQKHSHS